MSEFALRVGSAEYGGWKSLRLTRSIEALAGSFAFEFAEKWAGQDESWPVTDDDKCTVVFGGKSVLTGYVESADIDFTSARVEGKDRAAELVDCSAVLDKWEFLDTPVERIARDLCTPYDIAVSVQAGLTLPHLPKKFSVDPGSTAGAALEDLCRIAGVLPVSDGLGGVTLMRAGSGRCSSAIVQGQNMLSGSVRRSRTGRFGEYRVLGQHKGSDTLNGANAAKVLGTAFDKNVRASRVLVVRPEGNVTQAQAKARAEWEATVRAARATSFTVTLQGWTQADGTLWPLNALVPVRSPRLRVDEELLITSTEFSLTVSGGATTTLELRDPRGFLPQSTIPLGVGVDRTWREIRRGV